MRAADVVHLINLFSAGLLAGEEFVIRYGVRGPLASLKPKSHIKLRQALIRTLRVLVPAIFGATLLSGVGAAVLAGFDPHWLLRVASVAALLTFIGVTLFGTVPINKAALTWDPSEPPGNWQALVRKWERLDTVRCWAALIAFALALAAGTFPGR